MTRKRKISRNSAYILTCKNLLFLPEWYLRIGPTTCWYSNSIQNNQSSKNEIKRPGECAFSRGNWCDYEQDPDDDLDWSISSDGYALILLNQHQKLQYGRLLSPFIRSKVSYKSFLINFLLIFDFIATLDWT